MFQRSKALFGSLVVAGALALSSGSTAQAGDYLQCVPFARMLSGIQIFGDAWTWWKQATTGLYPTGFTPKAGAVLVFKPNGAMRLGHVAVVSQVLTDRVIQISHANWSVIEGSRGKIENNVTVVDVSPSGDWSQVKVWYDPIRDLGTTVYPTYGFIYNNAGGAARDAARAVTQTAVNQMVAAVPTPNSGPAKILSQAADSTDRIAALIAQTLTGGGGDKDGKDKQ